MVQEARLFRYTQVEINKEDPSFDDSSTKDEQVEACFLKSRLK